MSSVGSASSLHTSQVFALVEQTLAAKLPEALRSQPTVNGFSLHRHDLQRSLQTVLSGNSSKSVLAISDGVVKSSGCSDLSIDDLIVEDLHTLKFNVEKLSLSQLMGCARHDVHASVDAVALLKKVLEGKEPMAVLVIGSGSVTDIVKHAVFELQWTHIPFVVLPTALTVTAFTSHFAVLEEAGAKRTRLSRRVDYCLWFAPVLASAPAEMTRAGYGDLLARFVAYGDWYLGWRFGIAERYDELAFHLMEPLSEKLKARAANLRTWPTHKPAIEDLSAILAMAGIAMSVSGETTPLSGYEHTISHALDYLRLTSRRPLCWHGEQVALASLSSAESYDQLLAMEKLDLLGRRFASEEKVRRTIEQMIATAPYFGSAEAVLTAEERKQGLDSLQENLVRATQIFLQDYLKKHQQWQVCQSRLAEIEAGWPETRAHLRTLVISGAEMRALVERSGLALAPEELSQPTSALEYRWALRFSPFVRARVSLGDVIFWLGEDPAVWAAV